MNIELLKKISKRSDHKSFHHAVLVLKSSALLAQGYNVRYRHAEIMALEKLWPSKRMGTTIISFMVRKSGSFGNSFPCDDCWRYLVENKVSKIIYYDGKEWIQERI